MDKLVRRRNVVHDASVEHGLLGGKELMWAWRFGPVGNSDEFGGMDGDDELRSMDTTEDGLLDL